MRALSRKESIELCILGWVIEQLFKDTNQLSGPAEYQTGKARGAVSHLHLVAVAYPLLSSSCPQGNPGKGSGKISPRQNSVNLSKKYKIESMVDCSFLPMICWHKPRKHILEFFGAQGCQGWNYIVEIDSHCIVRCLSFFKDCAGKAKDIKYLWNNSSHFSLFRDWVRNAPPPCDSCDYLEPCRGGCHSTAEVLTGNILAPDPECPFIVGDGQKANV